MSLTISNTEKDVWGRSRIVFFDAAFDSSYPTNGEPLVAADIGLASITRLEVSGKNGYIFEYDYSGSLLKVLYPTANQGVVASGISVTSGAASATAVDSTTPTVTIPAGFRSEVDHSIGEEVEDTANLSALTGVKCIAYGIV